MVFKLNYRFDRFYNLFPSRFRAQKTPITLIEFVSYGINIVTFFGLFIYSEKDGVFKISSCKLLYPSFYICLTICLWISLGIPLILFEHMLPDWFRAFIIPYSFLSFYTFCIYVTIIYKRKIIEKYLNIIQQFKITPTRYIYVFPLLSFISSIVFVICLGFFSKKLMFMVCFFIFLSCVPNMLDSFVGVFIYTVAQQYLFLSKKIKSKLPTTELEVQKSADEWLKLQDLTDLHNKVHYKLTSIFLSIF